MPSDMPEFPFETSVGGPRSGPRTTRRHFDKELSEFITKSTKLTQLHPQLATRLLKDSLIPAYYHLFQLTGGESVSGNINHVIHPTHELCPWRCARAWLWRV